MLKKYVYQGEEFAFDDATLLVQEAVWLEEHTGRPARRIVWSYQNGGAIGVIAFLMLAMRRNGRHSLADWNRLQTIDLGTDELVLVDVDQTPDDGDEAEAENPTDAPSPTTPAGTSDDDPAAAKPSRGSPKS